MQAIIICMVLRNTTTIHGIGYLPLQFSQTPNLALFYGWRVYGPTCRLCISVWASLPPPASLAAAGRLPLPTKRNPTRQCASPGGDGGALMATSASSSPRCRTEAAAMEDGASRYPMPLAVAFDQGRFVHELFDFGFDLMHLVGMCCLRQILKSKVLFPKTPLVGNLTLKAECLSGIWSMGQ